MVARPALLAPPAPSAGADACSLLCSTHDFRGQGSFRLDIAVVDRGCVVVLQRPVPAAPSAGVAACSLLCSTYDFKRQVSSPQAWDVLLVPSASADACSFLCRTYDF